MLKFRKYLLETLEFEIYACVANNLNDVKT